MDRMLLVKWNMNGRVRGSKRKRNEVKIPALPFVLSWKSFLMVAAAILSRNGVDSSVPSFDRTHSNRSVRPESTQPLVRIPRSDTQDSSTLALTPIRSRGTIIEADESLLKPVPSLHKIALINQHTILQVRVSIDLIKTSLNHRSLLSGSFDKSPSKQKWEITVDELSNEMGTLCAALPIHHDRAFIPRWNIANGTHSHGVAQISFVIQPLPATCDGRVRTLVVALVESSSSPSTLLTRRLAHVPDISGQSSDKKRTNPIISITLQGNVEILSGSEQHCSFLMDVMIYGLLSSMLYLMTWIASHCSAPTNASLQSQGGHAVEALLPTSGSNTHCHDSTNIVRVDRPFDRNDDNSECEYPPSCSSDDDASSGPERPPALVRHFVDPSDFFTCAQWTESDLLSLSSKQVADKSDPMSVYSVPLHLFGVSSDTFDLPASKASSVNTDPSDICLDTTLFSKQVDVKHGMHSSVGHRMSSTDQYDSRTIQASLSPSSPICKPVVSLKIGEVSAGDRNSFELIVGNEQLLLTTTIVDSETQDREVGFEELVELEEATQVVLFPSGCIVKEAGVSQAILYGNDNHSLQGSEGTQELFMATKSDTVAQFRQAVGFGASLVEVNEAALLFPVVGCTDSNDGESELTQKVAPIGDDRSFEPKRCQGPENKNQDSVGINDAMVDYEARSAAPIATEGIMKIREQARHVKSLNDDHSFESKGESSPHSDLNAVTKVDLEAHNRCVANIHEAVVGGDHAVSNPSELEKDEGAGVSEAAQKIEPADYNHTLESKKETKQFRPTATKIDAERRNRLTPDIDEVLVAVDKAELVVPMVRSASGGGECSSTKEENLLDYEQRLSKVIDCVELTSDERDLYLLSLTRLSDSKSSQLKFSATEQEGTINSEPEILPLQLGILNNGRSPALASLKRTACVPPQWSDQLQLAVTEKVNVETNDQVAVNDSAQIRVHEARSVAPIIISRVADDGGWRTSWQMESLGGDMPSSKVVDCENLFYDHKGLHFHSTKSHQSSLAEPATVRIIKQSLPQHELLIHGEEQISFSVNGEKASVSLASTLKQAETLRNADRWGLPRQDRKNGGQVYQDSKGHVGRAGIGYEGDILSDFDPMLRHRMFDVTKKQILEVDTNSAASSYCSTLPSEPGSFRTRTFQNAKETRKARSDGCNVSIETNSGDDQFVFLGSEMSPLLSSPERMQTKTKPKRKMTFGTCFIKEDGLVVAMDEVKQPTPHLANQATNRPLATTRRRASGVLSRKTRHATSTQGCHSKGSQVSNALVTNDVLFQEKAPVFVPDIAPSSSLITALDKIRAPVWSFSLKRATNKDYHQRKRKRLKAEENERQNPPDHASAGASARIRDRRKARRLDDSAALGQISCSKTC